MSACLFPWYEPGTKRRGEEGVGSVARVTGLAPQGLNPQPAAQCSAAMKPEMNLRMVLASTEKKMHSLSLRTAERDCGKMLCN